MLLVLHLLWPSSLLVWKHNDVLYLYVILEYVRYARSYPISWLQCMDGHFKEITS